MRLFFLLCAALAVHIATANPAPDVKRESPLKLVHVQQNKTGEMKRVELLHKLAGKVPVWPEGLTESPYHYGGNCTPEFNEYRERCFGFFSDPMAWIDAERHCWLYGANLASIHDKLENDFLIELMLQNGYYGPAWIGASDAVQFGNWLWSDGSVFGAKNLAPGLPNSWFRRKQCLSIRSDESRFDRCYCEEKLPFICGTRPGLC